VIFLGIGRSFFGMGLLRGEPEGYFVSLLQYWQEELHYFCFECFDFFVTFLDGNSVFPMAGKQGCIC